jgi:signal transduction histidine kinase
MAIRFGGRLELEGGSEVLILPADNVSERNEREALRKELDEARKQGEAYARELAAAFAQGEGSGSTSPSTFPPMERSADRFAILAQFAGGIASELRSIISPIGRDLQSLRSAVGSSASQTTSGGGGLEEQVELVRRRFLVAQDFVAGLAALGELDPGELPAEIEFIEVARTAIRQASARAERGEVAVKLVTIPEGPDARAYVRSLPRCAAVLARELVLQAVAASPRGSEVVVVVAASGQGDSPELGLRITVDDAGAPLPASARRALLSLELDPGTYARPSAVPLFICAEIASATGALLELADAPSGGLRVSVTYPR